MGGKFESTALDRLVEASGHYPYFIQEFGSALWEVALDTLFTSEDAGFFPSRWDHSTPRERDYMNAMAKDGEGPFGTGEIAHRLGRKVTSMGKLPGELVAKGLTYSPEYGQVAFTVPGMSDFIERQNLSRPDKHQGSGVRLNREAVRLSLHHLLWSTLRRGLRRFPARSCAP